MTVYIMPHDHDDHPHSLLPSDVQLRVRALETILTEKGLIDPKALDVIIDTYQNRIGPQIGAELVARAWYDPAWKQQLIADTDNILDNLGLAGRQGEHVVIVENSSDCHNLVVCTLCSCYPWPLLGIPPAWYKSDEYRSRAVREPRAILKEFGVEFAEDVNVRVWDSTAEIRYLVLPRCPFQARGLPVDELIKWVTRDSMIGAGLPRPPR